MYDLICRTSSSSGRKLVVAKESAIHFLAGSVSISAWLEVVEHIVSVLSWSWLKVVFMYFEESAGHSPLGADAA